MISTMQTPRPSVPRSGAPRRIVLSPARRTRAGRIIARTCADSETTARLEWHARHRAAAARGKMTSNQIVFDIRRVVPEHVRPLSGARVDPPPPHVHSEAFSDTRMREAARLFGTRMKGTYP